MKRKMGKWLQLFVGIVLMTILLLFTDLLIFGIVVIKNNSVNYQDMQEIETHLLEKNGNYQLDEQARASLLKHQQFAMLLGKDGSILWSEALPEQLRKTYTVQDVAKFTRYYLEDYPVRTYVVEQGLLVIGGTKDRIWKYTFEFDVTLMENLLKVLPLLFMSNIIVLVTVPTWLQKRRAKKKEEERTEWIAGVSHDIRTPLAIVLGNAQIIAGLTQETEVRHRAKSIETQGIRLRRLVDNLNLSSKLEFGAGKFEKHTVRISRFLRKILTEIMNQMEDDRYQFTLDIDDALQELELCFSEDLVERAVMNLLHNAICHNTDGCKIEMRLYQDRKNHVFLELGDNGKGVSKEFLSRLNRSGYQRKSGTGQHGRGLKIVKQVADWHRWKIFFSEGEQGGLICTIRLR
ncbi:HAMP domain-containing sensor histidine kinase [Peptoniphilus equinus]|uniref:histidine kinase n=1 Tax=Peptoniphilus equinus TaxID=3016343 RepID=A0ABY7QWL4_9FIRM|nr:HAMP domain-containing sensor histidine kinase [Peptoniphilus equinus]WBW50470.1 HAMP domain-containing sensor histidine kinase [Peptoniphilus equinus]